MAYIAVGNAVCNPFEARLNMPERALAGVGDYVQEEVAITFHVCEHAANPY